MAASAATGLELGLASAAWLGAGAWPAWFAVVRGQGAFVADAVSLSRQVTVQATLSLLGLDRTSALIGQAAVGLVVAAGVALAWRRGPDGAAPGEAAVGALLAGTLLATPYAFEYDLPLAAAAALGLLARERPMGWPIAGIAAAVLLLPALLSTTSRFFWAGPVVLAALFALCVVLARRRPG